jgi:flagellar biosynthesis GTPase FlhF
VAALHFLVTASQVGLEVEAYSMGSEYQHLIQAAYERSTDKWKYIVSSIEDLANLPLLILIRIYEQSVGDLWNRRAARSKLNRRVFDIMKEQVEVDTNQTAVDAKAAAEAERLKKAEERRLKAEEARVAREAAAAARKAAAEAKAADRAKAAEERKAAAAAKKAEREAAKATKPTPSPKGPRSVYKPEEVITVLVAENPKRGISAERFAKYRTGMTVKEALEAGVLSADLTWDTGRRFINIGATTVEVPTPTSAPATESAPASA